MHPQRTSPRGEYRQQVKQRVNDSVTLAVKYPHLRSLTVELVYFEHDELTRCGSMKYSANLENARAVFRFDCPNYACVCGDFDLSEELARAVAGRRTSLVGEACCQGWRSRETINAERCLNILRYKLSLKY